MIPTGERALLYHSMLEVEADQLIWLFHTFSKVHYFEYRYHCSEKL